MRRFAGLLISVVVCGNAIAAPVENSPPGLGAAGFQPSPVKPFGWRGDGSGRFPDANPPTQWSETKNIRWSAVVGKSYSSPIVTDKLAIVTSEPNLIVCVNRTDGKVLWKDSVKPADLSDPESRKTAEEYEPPKAGSGVAAATPICDGKFVYAIFANGLIRADDLSGKPQWTSFIGAAQNTGYGRSASPIFVTGKLIVHMTNLYAFDPATGKQIWVNTDVPSSYGSPAGLKIGDVDLIVTPRGHVVRADTGKTVAEDIGHSGNPSPIAQDDIIYFGDVMASAVRLNAGFKDTELWNATLPDDVFGSPILHDGVLFVVTGKGELHAFAANGKGENKPLFKPRQLFEENESGEPVAFASLTLAGKYLFLSGNQGGVVVLEATRDAKPVAVNKFPGSGGGSTPVFSGKEMFLRSGERLFCIGQ